MRKILLIEEDAHQATLLFEGLKDEGFDVFHLINEEELLDELDSFILYPPDLILLGVSLAGKMDGFELSKKIREKSRIPILFHSDRIQIDDLQKGFQIGNVDYLKRPFLFPELILRIYELLARNQQGQYLAEKRVQKKVHQIGNYTFTPAELSLALNDIKIHLPKNESEVLKFLCENEGKVMTRNEVLAFVWDDRDLKQKEASLNNILYSLRIKLRNDKRIEIRTIQKVGFLLVINKDKDNPADSFVGWITE